MRHCSCPLALHYCNSMRLWIGLYLPQLPLEVFSPRWCNSSSNGGGADGADADNAAAGDPGIVVLEQERVMALSKAAHIEGVLPGMRRGGVLMLMPDARIVNFGHLQEAHTYAWRSDEVAMATVLDHRFGQMRDQIHVWQATIDAQQTRTRSTLLILAASSASPPTAT